MKRIGVALVLLAAALATILMLASNGKATVGTDPAYTFHTRGRSDHYGGIDRWSYHGMDAERFAARLEAAGYSCPSSVRRVGYEPPRGVRELVCSRAQSSPLPRTLTITARVDHDNGGRLVAVGATSTLSSGASWAGRLVVDPLRAAGLVEPAALVVGGFSPDSIEVFVRLVADALHPAGWHLACADGDNLPQCLPVARERLRTGLPPLPSGAAPATRARRVDTVMRGIGLVPVAAQDESYRRPDGLLVRVSGDEMWLDYSGQTFSGTPLKAAVALAPMGGAPTKLNVAAGHATMTVALAGEPEKNNSSESRYLVPIAATSEHRMAEWLDLPDAPSPRTASRIAKLLPNVEPAFLPRMIAVIAAKLAQPDSPEEILGLYPVLRSVERRATLLRSAQSHEWFPSVQRRELILAMHPADAAMRAAWAMALCQESVDDFSVDSDCWHRLALSDANVVEVLRSAVAEQQEAYADLPPSHPLTRRLEWLREMLVDDASAHSP